MFLIDGEKLVENTLFSSYELLSDTEHVQRSDC